jgi:hypothetical protein
LALYSSLLKALFILLAPLAKKELFILAQCGNIMYLLKKRGEGMKLKQQRKKVTPYSDSRIRQ